MTAPNNSLLAGIRVLDLSRLLPGPFCTLYLAQLGAEVIKIEEPDGGDYARGTPEMFNTVNRGKRSVALDLRKPEHVKALHKLVETADVLIESFRPGVMDRLGCSYETLSAINPKLVYASLTGYGHTGPYRDLAGHDMNYLGYAGVLDQIGGSGGPPTLSNVQIADLAGGALTCAIGILSAVIGARDTGKGAFVDVAMLDGSLALAAIPMSTLRTLGQTMPRGEDMLSGALPNYNLYRCRDGKYLAVGALEPKFFQRLLNALRDDLLPETVQRGLEQAMAMLSSRGGAKKKGGSKGKSKSEPKGFDKMGALMADPRRARKTLAPVRWALRAAFLLKPRDEWARLLFDADACVGPVLSVDEALDNEQVRARGLVEDFQGKPALRNPIRFVGADTVSGAAPELGADTAAVLKAAGLSAKAIAKIQAG